MDIKLTITKKQREFVSAQADEVLFGGAAGGGKSYGQVIDALLYAIKYPKSKQIIFRRSYPELEKSIIRTMLSIYPRKAYSYNVAKHVFTFYNGSVIDCGFLQQESDVYAYQSAEYDVIRFDELTHFTEYTYLYMLSRLRGANDNPKFVKSSTNPTGQGRVWVKERFVDIGEAGLVHKIKIGERDGQDIMQTRLFIPSKVFDNCFLMKRDGGYVNRLEHLPEQEKRGLLYGEWDCFLGQYFDEFRRDKHTCTPFIIPPEWRVYMAMDYGLDMLACYWLAMDSTGNVYVFRELTRSNLPISQAAKLMKEATRERVYLTLAPPDMWNRSQETGKSKAAIFYENGVNLTKSNNDREAGWLAVKELLAEDANGDVRLHIFSTCTQLIKHLPALQRDNVRPTDCADSPHEITHSPDALRYFAIYWSSPSPQKQPTFENNWSKDKREDYRNADKAEKALLLEKWKQSRLPRQSKQGE